MEIVVEVLSQLETLTITKEALEVKILFVIKVNREFRLNFAKRHVNQQFQQVIILTF